jgi:hypothetical protein
MALLANFNSFAAIEAGAFSQNHCVGNMILAAMRELDGQLRVN